MPRYAHPGAAPSARCRIPQPTSTATAIRSAPRRAPIVVIAHGHQQLTQHDPLSHERVAPVATRRHPGLGPRPQPDCLTLSNCLLDRMIDDHHAATHTRLIEDRTRPATPERSPSQPVAAQHRQVPGPTRTALPTTAQRRPTDHQNTSPPALDTLQRNLSRRSRSSPMRAA